MKKMKTLFFVSAFLSFCFGLGVLMPQLLQGEGQTEIMEPMPEEVVSEPIREENQPEYEEIEAVEEPEREVAELEAEMVELERREMLLEAIVVSESDEELRAQVLTLDEPGPYPVYEEGKMSWLELFLAVLDDEGNELLEKLIELGAVSSLDELALLAEENPNMAVLPEGTVLKNTYRDPETGKIVVYEDKLDRDRFVLLNSGGRPVVLASCGNPIEVPREVEPIEPPSAPPVTPPPPPPPPPPDPCPPDEDPGPDPPVPPPDPDPDPCPPDEDPGPDPPVPPPDPDPCPPGDPGPDPPVPAPDPQPCPPDEGPGPEPDVPSNPGGSGGSGDSGDSGGSGNDNSGGPGPDPGLPD